MKRFIRDRQSPALIVAIVALVAAVGGTALAGPVAFSAKSDTKQDTKTFKALAKPIRSRWVAVASDGTIVAQTGGFTLAHHSAGSGSYYISVGQDVSHRAVIASLNYGSFENASPHTGEISSSPCGHTSSSNPLGTTCVFGANNTRELFVKTADDGGTGSDRGFYLEIPGR